MPIHLHEITLDEFSVRAALIRGTRSCLIWDTLTHPRDMAGLREIQAECPTFIAYSHADWDHIWGTAAFDAAIPVIAHRHCRLRFETDVPRTLAEFQRDQPGKWDEVRLVPPVLTFENELDVDLGGLTVQLHYLPGHTKDSLVAFLPEANLLLAGDTVEWPCPCVPATCDLDRWIDGLNSWRDQPELRVIPSHGPVGGVELLDRTVAYLDGLRLGHPMAMPAVTAFYARAHQENLLNRGLV